jgi:hypothetical protein
MSSITDLIEKANPLQKESLKKLVEHPDSIKLMQYLIKYQITSPTNARMLVKFKPVLVNIFYDSCVLGIRIQKEKKYYFLNNYGLRIYEKIKESFSRSLKQ